MQRQTEKLSFRTSLNYLLLWKIQGNQLTAVKNQFHNKFYQLPFLMKIIEQFLTNNLQLLTQFFAKIFSNFFKPNIIKSLKMLDGRDS